MAKRSTYVHGTSRKEQARLAKLNEITNASYLDFLSLRGHEKVLEVGSGLGILTSAVSRELKTGCVVGVEYSEDQLAKAPPAGRRLRFVRGDAHHLPFEDNSFDVVYSRYVLEHVADPVRVLKEMRRVLKRGGSVFTLENNIAMNLFYPECPVYVKLWKDLGTLQSALGGDAYIGIRLFALLNEAGFRKVVPGIFPEVHYYGSPSFNLWVDNTLDILRGAEEGFIEHGLAQEGEVDAAEIELKEFKKNKNASTIFYWNRVKGIK